MGDLNDFKWEDASEEVDFFEEAQEASTEDNEKTETSVKEEEETEITAEINEDVEEDIFSKVNEDEEIEEEVSEKTFNNISTFDILQEKGLIEYEDEEELTDEKKQELVESFDIEEVLNERVKETLKSLPEEGQQFIQYALKGGDLSSFIQNVAKNTPSGITKDIDLEEETNQELVAREMLRLEGEDSEAIDAQIDFYKDSGKLKMFSEKKFAKWKANDDVLKANLLKEQEERVEAEKERIRVEKEAAKEFIENNKEIGGLTFSKNDIKELPSYMNDKTVKLQNGSYITQMQKELFMDLPKNKEAFMQLSVLMKNRNKDGTFNFESIAKETKTKLVKKVKENVRRSKSTPTKSLNKGGVSKQALADIFNQ